MKFEIRRAQNGVVLSVEPDFPDAKSEEVVYQERGDDGGRNKFKLFDPLPELNWYSLSLWNK
jgi:hypothetical protein